MEDGKNGSNLSLLFSIFNPPSSLFRNRFRISARISPLVCSEVRFELLMTFAPSAIISGATARWLSRWSRAARFSCTPSAARRRERSSSFASR